VGAVASALLFGPHQVKVRSAHGSLLIGGASMVAKTSDRAFSADAAARGMVATSTDWHRAVWRPAMVALAAAALGGCVHAMAAGEQPAAVAVSEPSVPTGAATVERKPSRRASNRQIVRKGASDGMASFYRHGSRTASGERFNPRELTAAHPTLPFGTRVRVTNVKNGQSVTVRVNDRGPFVKGRVIDVSHAAAESLGMTGSGVAKVKLDVVE
jgi:rare lipoprotein A